MAAGWGPTAGDAALDALFSTYSWLQLHIGSPGPNGTNNVATNSTRKQPSMAAAAAGSKTSNADVDWTAVIASETYTHITLWTASSAGTFGASGVLTANPVTTGDNFTIPSGQLTATVTLAS